MRCGDELRAALLAGTYGREEVLAPTLADFQVRFLEHADTNDKQSAARAKRHILTRHLVPEFGEMRLDLISKGKIEAYKARKLKAELSKKTVNNHLAVLSALLRVAREFDELPAVYRLPEIEWLRAPKPTIDFLTFEDADKLVSGLSSDRWGTMIRIALHTGLRIGELCVLQWADVDLKAGRVTVNRSVDRGTLDLPKGGRTRVVPLTRAAAATLQAWPQRLSCPWVFPQRDGGYIRNPHQSTSEAIAEISERVLGRRIGWHTLRHTFASHLVMKGVSLRVVQAYLGHQSIEQTERYSHLAPAHQAEAIHVLDAPGAQEGNKSPETTKPAELPAG